jgi:hypothetical protein
MELGEGSPREGTAGEIGEVTNWRVRDPRPRSRYTSRQLAISDQITVSSGMTAFLGMTTMPSRIT